ncbi:hypothetical protein BH10ACT11_BH10ACT11_12370 [soil metagenome]
MLGLGDWTRRRALVFAGATIVVALVAGSVDFGVTAGLVPDPPPGCAAGSPPSCESSRTDAFQARIDRTAEREGGLGARADLYLLIALAGVAFAVISELRAREPAQRGAVMTDLGVAGVIALIGGGVTVLLVASSYLSAPTAQIWGLGLAMVAGAFAGSVAVSAGGGFTSAEVAAASGRPRSVKQLWDEVPWVVRLTSLSAILGLVFCVLYSGTVPECSSGEQGDANATYGWLATIFAAAGMLGALACLALRHWAAALLALAAGVVAILIAALSGLC